MFNNIKTIRKNLDLTQEQVSLLTGVLIKTLRNMISHEYEGANIKIIYDIALNRIPELLTELEK